MTFSFDTAQMQRFGAASFARRMAPLLSSLDPRAADRMPAEALEATILAQVERAREHGFCSERDCARWVLAAWCLGPGFDSRISGIAELLEQRDLPVPCKALALELMLHAMFAGLAGHSQELL